MLKVMRNNRKVLVIVLWVVILAFVSTIFFIWGKGTDQNERSYVAKIDGYTISYNEFDNYISSLRDSGMNTNEASVKFSAVNDLITKRLLILEAGKLGVPVSDYEIANYIKGIPAFQDNGTFDPEAYFAFLRSNGLSADTFENSLKEGFLMSKLEMLIRGSQSVVSNEAALNEYDYRNKTLKVSYIKIPVSSFISKEAPNEAALIAYYDANKTKYATTAKIALKYATFSKSDFQNKIKIEDAEIEKYYNDNIAQYSTPESVVIRSILIPVVTWLNEKEANDAKAIADKVHAELIEKKITFVKAYEKYSDKRYSKEGGLIGKIKRGELQPEVENAAFALEPNAISSVIKTDAGYQILSIDEKTVAHTATLQDKRAEIVAILIAGKSDAVYREYILSLYRDIVKAGNLSAYNEANPDKKLELESTPIFAQNESAKFAFLAGGMSQNLFALNQGEISQPMSVGDNVYIFEIVQKIPSVIPDLKSVETVMTLEYKYSEALKKSVSSIKELLDKGEFEKIASDYKTKVENLTDFSKTKPAPLMTQNPDIMNSLLRVEAGKTLTQPFVIGVDVYAFKVNAVVPASPSDFERQKQGIIAEISSIKQAEAYNSYVESLREKAKIDINPAFFESLK